MSSDGTSTHRLDTAHRLRRSVAVAVATLVAGVAFGLPGPTSHAAALDHDEGLSTGDPTVGTRFASGLSVSGGDRAVVASWPRQRVKGLRISLRGHKTGRGGRVLPRWAKWGRARQLHAKATRFVFKGLRNAREYQVKLDVKHGRKWHTLASGIAVANAPRFTPGPISLISTSSSGVPGNQDSDHPGVSANGAKVIFRSLASNLIGGDTNDQADIFVKDLATGATARVSTASDGAQANGRSDAPAISPDGSTVAFISDAPNLVPGDTNGVADGFVKHLYTGATRRLSVAADGTEANGSTTERAFARDGSSLALTSYASNLVADDGDRQSDIFIKRLDTGAITWGSDPRGGCAYGPALSPDGSTLAYVDYISPGFGADSGEKVLLRSLASGSVTRAVTSNTNDAYEISFSSDGSRIIYRDSGTIGDIVINIVDLASGSLTHLDGGFHPTFSPDGGRVLSDGGGANVTNLADGSSTLVSTSAGGVPGNGAVFHSTFMPDGTRILFASDATNLVPNWRNGDTHQIYLKAIA